MLLIVAPKRALWGYQEELWFSYLDSPKEITLTALSPGAQQAVSRAIGKGALIEVDKNGKPVRKALQKLQLPLVDNPEPDGLQGVPHFLAEKLKELLENGVTSLKREIPLVQSAVQVAALIALERCGKNRKTVLSLLDVQLTKTGDLSSARQLSGSMSMYDSLIEEEAGETVEFDTQSIEVIEEKGDDFKAESVAPEVLEASDEVVELEGSNEEAESELKELVEPEEE